MLEGKSGRRPICVENVLFPLLVALVAYFCTFSANAQEGLPTVGDYLNRHNDMSGYFLDPGHHWSNVIEDIQRQGNSIIGREPEDDLFVQIPIDVNRLPGKNTRSLRQRYEFVQSEGRPMLVWREGNNAYFISICTWFPWICSSKEAESIVPPAD